MINIITTFPLKQKHMDAVKEIDPGIRLEVFGGMEQAGDRLPAAEILVTYGEDLTDRIINTAKHLKWIQVISAGLEKMPFKAIMDRDILVTNARGIHRTPMSEYVLGAMLAVERKSFVFYDLQKEAAWDRSVRVGELEGKKICIVGLGAIGQEIARKARAFGMHVSGIKNQPVKLDLVDDVGGPDRLHSMLEDSDYVVVTVPLTEQTRGMFGAREFGVMKRDAWFINISRGGVVNQNALVKALEARSIGGAVLDVYDREPLPGDSPLWKMDNVIMTPHVSGRSPKYIKRAMEIFHHNLRVYLGLSQDRMINVIDPRRGY